MPNIKDTIFFVNREQEERHAEEHAKKLNMSYANLLNYPLTDDVLKSIDEGLVMQYRIIPYLKVGNTLKVGIVDPEDAEVKKFLEEYKKKTGFELVPALVSHSSFVFGASLYEKYRMEEEQKKMAQALSENTFEFNSGDLDDLREALKKVNTTQLLDAVIEGALKNKSSDIHFEPFENDFLIRYRIDGILQDVSRLPITQYKSLISRIKFLSKLRMDIEDTPQDGRFSYNSSSEPKPIDLRVSIMPSTFGESIVIRLLGQERSILSLDALGFREDALAVIKAAISKPHGMILTSGPTGSGKTSTLYAILIELKKPGVKIISLENPVEYRIEGIEQSQIKPGQGYEFADGLKASLRQDPDILMVGEVRDTETAETAIQAALTGHLLLSTIHANSAPAVFPRLLEIGVKPFLLSGSINLVMAQRLIRKVCKKCGESIELPLENWQEIKRVLEPIKAKLPAELQERLLQEKGIEVKGKGCEQCNMTGFSGRQAIIEVLEPNDSIEKLISQQSSISEFEKAAWNSGMVTMEQDGFVKVLQGVTTLEEVWRVTRS